MQQHRLPRKLSRMVMKLEKVVPFGRSLDEYKSMFALSSDDLKKNIVGIGDGPSFSAETFALGKTVVPLTRCIFSRPRKLKADSIRSLMTSLLRSKPLRTTGSGPTTSHRST